MIPEPFGPAYPDLGAGVAKFRSLVAKAGSIRAMARADVVAYADAIEKAIRAKHRTLHMRPTPSETGGWYKVPSVTRLLKYDNPIPMAGDPPKRNRFKPNPSAHSSTAGQSPAQARWRPAHSATAIA